MPKQRRFSEGNRLDTPGRRIRFMRQAKEWNQATLASKVGTSQPAISQWENDLWLPTKMFQTQLAEVLGTTRAFLFGEADQQAAS